MGTAFICFRVENDDDSSKKHTKVVMEIGKIVFRSIIETMEQERPEDIIWKGHLDAAYGMKWLYVGEKERDDFFDFGFAFLNAIKCIRENGPPDYYPKQDIELLYQQLEVLESTYIRVCEDSKAT